MRSSHLDALLPEMREKVMPYLLLADIGRLGCVSQSWCGFTTQTPSWMSFIVRDFDMPEAVLLRFHKYATHLAPGFPIPFRTIYHRMRFLSAQYKKRGLYPFYRLPEYHLPLLACCADHPHARSLLDKLIPKDEAHEWMTASILMHANESVQGLIDLFPHLLSKGMIEMAIESGTAPMAIFMLEKSKIKNHVGMIMCAASAGNAELLFYLLRQFTIEDAVQRAKVAACVMRFGDFKLFFDVLRYFEDNDQAVNLLDCHARDSSFNLLEMAAHSPNKSMFPYVVGRYPELIEDLWRFDLISILAYDASKVSLIYALAPDLFEKPLPHHLMLMFISTDVETVRFVIDTLHAKPRKILKRIEKYNDVYKYEQVIKYLIEQYDLVPSHELLNKAAASETLFRYLLAKFQFTPDNSALQSALYSRNIKLFDDLCKTYSIEPTQETLMAAFHIQDIGLFNFFINKFSLQIDDEEVRFAQHWHVGVARIALLTRLGDDFLIDERTWINSEVLIHSHRQIFQGLEKCRDENFVAAEEHWLEAAKNSIRHFTAFITRAMTNPSQYRLNENHFPILRKAAQQASFIPMTMTEREAIYPMLQDSNDIELRELAAVFSPDLCDNGVKCQI